MRIDSKFDDLFQFLGEERMRINHLRIELKDCKFSKQYKDMKNIRYDGEEAEIINIHNKLVSLLLEDEEETDGKKKN